MVKTGFIGAGTTGTALAVRLSQKECPVVAVSSRTLSSAQKLARLVPNCQVCHTAQEVADAAGLVFITTPDDVIAQVCGRSPVALIPWIFWNQQKNLGLLLAPFIRCRLLPMLTRP